jgi:hypothetical protein
MSQMKPVQFSLAPKNLWQPISPLPNWFQGAQIGLFNIDLGVSPRPDIEQTVLEEVGSYGRQLGWIGEALEVLMNNAELGKLGKKERETLDIMRGKLAEIRRIKRRGGRNDSTAAELPQNFGS